MGRLPCHCGAIDCPKTIGGPAPRKRHLAGEAALEPGKAIANDAKLEREHMKLGVPRAEYVASDGTIRSKFFRNAPEDRSEKTTSDIEAGNPQSKKPRHGDTSGSCPTCFKENCTTCTDSQTGRDLQGAPARRQAQEKGLKCRFCRKKQYCCKWKKRPDRRCITCTRYKIICKPQPVALQSIPENGIKHTPFRNKGKRFSMSIVSIIYN